MGVIRYVFGQNFQRHEAAKLFVLRLVNDTHSTAAEFLDDAVTRNGLANHGTNWAVIIGSRWSKNIRVEPSRAGFVRRAARLA
jgi:hypothetical protein